MQLVRTYTQFGLMNRPFHYDYSSSFQSLLMANYTEPNETSPLLLEALLITPIMLALPFRVRAPNATCNKF